jgi:hypothetical protein
MEDEKLVRGVHRRQQLEVEPDLAEVLMTDRLFLLVVHVYLVAVPQQSERVTLGGHVGDQRRGGRIVVDYRADGPADTGAT